MKPQSRILVAQLSVLALLCLNSCTGSGVEFDLDHEPAVVTVVEQGWHLESSLNLEDGEYFCAAVAGPNTGELESAAILIEGQREVVLDLRGVVLRGADREADLDGLRGIGVLIRDCENIRVLGGTIGGYRVPIRVLRSRGVLIDGTNFDGWYAQPLHFMGGESDQAEGIDLHWDGAGDSTRRFERYGAAIAVAASSRITIRNCRGRHGQNGVLFEQVQDSSVIDSDFSFLSGWGCALFDSIRNEVSHDVFDYCVRGVAEGSSGGQGAAGILLAGATRSNVVAECSATHCGTGLRIVAGDSEGSAENTIAHSEFSFATCHGIQVEGPSEGDVFVSNQLGQAQQFGLRATNTTGLVCHDNVMSSARKGGVLLLDSEGSLISDNVIEDTECGIAVESSEASEEDGGADHWLIHNSLGRNLADLRLRALTQLRLERNRFNSPAGRLQLERISDAELGAVLGKEEALRRIMGRFTTPPAGLVSDVTF
ncbi:MAG: right-handed parallel beta-helix repeat-containing protein, partial [Planctomycetota bacterium]